MRKRIEQILIGAIFEEIESNESFAIESIVIGFKLLLEQKDSIFQRIPDQIFVSSDSLEEAEKISGINVGLIKDLKTNFGHKNEKTINYYDKKGLILHDGIYGSAYGRMNYIYRSKGIRIYLFEDGEIKIFSTYCTIDHHGFSLCNEEFDNFNLFEISSFDQVQDLINYFEPTSDNLSKSVNYSGKVINILTNIKEVFRKYYFIEFFLLPPDVDKLSKFSESIKSLLWEISLSKDFVKNWGESVQNNSMILLSSHDITPNIEQLLKFLNVKSANFEQIINRIEKLESTIVRSIEKNDKEDLIDFKPNFMGMGINGNEAYERLKKIFKKRKNIP